MIIKEILNRRSVRSYKPDEVPEKYLLEIVKAGQFAPTARNNRATEFLIVKNQQTKNKLFEIVGQEFVKEAPILIIPTSDTTKTNCPVQDLSVASQNIFLQAAALGLGSVWKNVGETEYEEEIKKILGVPKQFKIINIIPIGHPKEKQNPRESRDFSDKRIHWGKW